MPSIKSCVVIFAAFIGSSVCAASVPRLMNLQGRLTDKSGIPLSGAYEIRFSVWDSALGGVMLWDEKQNISCERGVFQAMLGSVNPLPPSVFSLGETRFLEIDIESPVNDPPMGPRQRLVAVAYAFIAEEAAHAATANEAVSAQTASLALSVPDGTITCAKLAPQAVTTQKISNLAVSEAKLADKSVTIAKLSDDALYTDDKAVSAAASSGLFLRVSTSAGGAGTLLLPSSSPVISASAPDGKIILANDTQVTGTLKIGTRTITIDSVAGEIDYNSVTTAYLTSSGQPIILRTRQGPHAMTLAPSGDLVLSPSGSGRIIFAANVNSDINFFGGVRTINSNQGLNLNTAGNGPVTTGTGLTTLGGNIQISGGEVLDPVGISRITLGDDMLFTSAVSTFSGKVLVAGNEIGDSAGTTRLTLGDTAVMTSSVTITGGAEVLGDVVVGGKIIGDGSQLTGITASGIDEDCRQSTGAIRSDLNQVKIDTGTLRADMDNLSLATGNFLDTTATRQTKEGGLNVLGNVGIGTTDPTEKLHVRGGLYVQDGTLKATRYTFGPIGDFVGQADLPSIIRVGKPRSSAHNYGGIQLGSYDNPAHIYGLDGNVGIGTAYPSANLQVVRDAAGYCSAIVDSKHPGWGADVQVKNSAGHRTYLFQRGPGFGGAPYGPFGTDGNNAGSLLYDGDKLLGVGTVSNTPLYLGTNNTARMTITSGGNVGIGTTEPSAKLHVAGNMMAGGPGPYYVGRGGGNPVHGKEGSWGDELISDGQVIKFLKLAPSNSHNAFIGLSQWNNTMFDSDRGIHFWDDTNGYIRLHARSYRTHTSTITTATPEEELVHAITNEFSGETRDISELAVAAGALSLQLLDRVKMLEAELAILKREIEYLKR